MTSRPRIALSLLVLLASAGAILAQSNQKDVDAVRAADEGWLKVYNARDLEKSVAFCDEQASMLAPNTPIATGKAALTEVIKADLGRPDVQNRMACGPSWRRAFRRSCLYGRQNTVKFQG